MATSWLTGVGLVVGASSPENAIGPNDGVYTDDVDDTSWVSGWTLDLPVGAINGDGEITVYAAKSNTGDPSFTVNLYNEAPAVIWTSDSQSITDPEMTFVIPVPLSAISDPNFESLTLYFTTSAAGGNPQQRSSVWLDAALVDLPVDGVGPPPGSEFRAWDGAQWVTGRLKRFDGAEWVGAVVQRWDGGAWVEVP